jgi:transcriptional regulator with XRE-family HTH domain
MEYSFGKKLKDLRVKHNFTQGELADELNKIYGSTINKGMISKWEHDREEPRMDAVRNIAKFFNTQLDDLLYLNSISGDQNPLSKKEERDIALDLERMLAELDSNEALAYNDEASDDDELSRELLKSSLENSLKLAKQLAKKKFTPNKHK